MMRTTFLGTLSVILVALTLGSGCVGEDVGFDVTLDSEEAVVQLPVMATFSASEGLRFVSEDVAGQWSETAPGVWENSDGTLRLTIAAAEDTRHKSLGNMSADVTCNIALYSGPSSPFIGQVGGAALAQLSCVNGTVAFTVEAGVCTETTGCGLLYGEMAYPDSTPRLWGTIRTGFGDCDSSVSARPPYVVSQGGTYTCG